MYWYRCSRIGIYKNQILHTHTRTLTYICVFDQRPTPIYTHTTRAQTHLVRSCCEYKGPPRAADTDAVAAATAGANRFRPTKGPSSRGAPSRRKNTLRGKRIPRKRVGGGGGGGGGGDDDDVDCMYSRIQCTIILFKSLQQTNPIDHGVCDVGIT